MNIKLSILKCLLLMVVVGALIVPSATAITSATDGLSDIGAGEVSNHEIDFNLQANLVRDGKIKILFPEGFNISAATNISDPTNWGDDGKYTFIRDVSSRTLIFQRDGSGSDYIAGDEVYFELGNIVNPNKGDYTITIYTTLSNDQPTPDIGTASVTITNGHATHLTIDTIASQVAGTSFPITVNARDQFENIDTTFGDPAATLSNSLGTITPGDINIIAGTGTDSVTITKTGTGNITVTSGTITGASNMFTVAPAALGSFVIATIPAQFDELAFTVTAQAKDTEGNNKTDYNAVNNLTVTSGLPGTVTIVSPSPATVQFVNGVYSGQVTLNVVPDPTPIAPQTGVRLTITNVTLGPSGTSNDFSISLPVDLKNSTVVADPVIVIEDGVSTSTITVTVKNGINQGVIPGATVVLVSDRSWMDLIVPPSNTTDSNGQATFSIRSGFPGKANLTATVWLTEVLEQKPVVTFGFDNKLHLAKGWNLVSVPRILANNSVSALNTNKVDKIYYYDTGSGVWKSAFYTSGNWSGTLTTIDDGKGYWINATAPADVSAVLKPIDADLLQFPPSYSLKAGWNMVGYTSVQLNLYNDLYPYFLGVPWITAYEYTGSGFKQAKPGGYGDLEEVLRTKGYWLYLSRDGTLVP